MKSLLKHIIVLVIMLQSTNIFSQEDWIREYHPEVESVRADITNAYDSGFILTGWHGMNFPTYSWLIKADVNGYPLWEKTIGEAGYTSVVASQRMNEYGDMYLIGGTFYTDGWSDPYIMKLNACGQQEWCRVFHTPNNYDFASELEIMPDGDVVITLRYHSYDPFDERICLVRMSPEGELKWRNYYWQDEQQFSNEEDTDILLLPDDRILITGWGYYEDQLTSISYMKSAFICTDEEGEVIWQNIVDHDYYGIDTTLHNANKSVYAPESDAIYSAIERVWLDDTRSPAIMKMSMDGELLGRYNLVDGYYKGFNSDVVLMSNKRLICSGFYGDMDREEDIRISKEIIQGSQQQSEANLMAGMGRFTRNPLDSTRAWICDTLGNIIKEHTFPMDYTSKIIKTLDGKYLFYNNTSIDEDDLPSTYLHKFNENLEYDSVYTREFEYDYLCDEEIVNDTIGLEDCVLVVGFEDEPGSSETTDMQLYPNPAADYVVIRLPEYYSKKIDSQYIKGTHNDYQYHNKALVEVLDMNGQLIHTYKIESGQTTINENISTWERGVYLVRLLVNGKQYQVKKLVVK